MFIDFEKTIKIAEIVNNNTLIVGYMYIELFIRAMIFLNDAICLSDDGFVSFESASTPLLSDE